MDVVRAQTPMIQATTPPAPVFHVVPEVRSGTARVRVNENDSVFDFDQGRYMPVRGACYVTFDPVFTDVPVVKVTASKPFAQGSLNVLATVTDVRADGFDFSIWDEEVNQLQDEQTTLTYDIQWFAVLPSDQAQDNCQTCDPYSYNDFFTDHGTTHVDSTWPGLGISRDGVTASVAPATYALEATIKKCGRDNFDFVLGTIHDIGFQSQYFDHNLPDGLNAYVNSSNSPYIFVSIGVVDEPTHPNFGGLYAGVGIIGAIPVPGGGGTLFRLGDIRLWKGSSDADLYTTTGVGGIGDGGEHTVRLEYYGFEDFAFFIDGVEYNDGLGVPRSAAQLSTGSGYPGTETHADWDNQVFLGYWYPYGSEADHGTPTSLKVESAVNVVFSDSGGWRLVTNPDTARTFLSL